MKVNFLKYILTIIGLLCFISFFSYILINGDKFTDHYKQKCIENDGTMIYNQCKLKDGNYLKMSFTEIKHSMEK